MNVIKAINDKAKQKEEYKQKLLDEIYEDVQRMSQDFNFSHANSYSNQVTTLMRMKRLLIEQLIEMSEEYND